jgi:hypothetical protein
MMDKGKEGNSKEPYFATLANYVNSNVASWVDREKRDLKRMNYHLDHLDQNCERRVGVSFRDFDLDSSSCCFVSQLRP